MTKVTNTIRRPFQEWFAGIVIHGLSYIRTAAKVVIVEAIVEANARIETNK